MERFKTLVLKASAALHIVSCTALIALMLLVTANVLMRAIFTSPILGTYDWTGFLTILIIGSALAYCELQNGHIEISFFTDKAGEKTRRWIGKIGQILSCLVLALFTYALFSMAGRLMRAGEVSVTTKTPVHYFAYFMAACFAVFTLAAFLKILDMKMDDQQSAGNPSRESTAGKLTEIRPQTSVTDAAAAEKSTETFKAEKKDAGSGTTKKNFSAEASDDAPSQKSSQKPHEEDPS